MLCISRVLHDVIVIKQLTSEYRRRNLISHVEQVCRQANSQRLANQEIWLHAKWRLKMY